MANPSDKTYYTGIYFLLCYNNSTKIAWLRNENISQMHIMLDILNFEVKFFNSKSVKNKIRRIKFIKNGFQIKKTKLKNKIYIYTYKKSKNKCQILSLKQKFIHTNM